MMGKWMDRLDLQEEPAPGQTIVEIAGQQRVLIERHGGVVGYGRQEVSVKVPYGLIHICGSGLELTKMTAQQLIISGCIECVRLERRPGA